LSRWWRTFWTVVPTWSASSEAVAGRSWRATSIDRAVSEDSEAIRSPVSSLSRYSARGPSDAAGSRSDSPSAASVVSPPLAEPLSALSVDLDGEGCDILPRGRDHW